MTAKKTEKKKSSSGKAPDKPASEKRKTTVYLFTGMAIKMALVIYLGIYFGQKIDQRTGFEVPWFTLVGSLAGVGASFYFVVQDLRKL